MRQSHAPIVRPPFARIVRSAVGQGVAGGSKPGAVRRRCRPARPDYSAHVCGFRWPGSVRMPMRCAIAPPARARGASMPNIIDAPPSQIDSLSLDQIPRKRLKHRHHRHSDTVPCIVRLRIQESIRAQSVNVVAVAQQGFNVAQVKLSLTHEVILKHSERSPSRPPTLASALPGSRPS